MQILLLISILIYVCTIIYYNKKKKEIYKKYIQKKKREIENAISEKQSEADRLSEKIQERNHMILLLGSQMKAESIQLENYKKEERQKIDEQIAEYEYERRKSIDLGLTWEKERKRKLAEEQHEAYLSGLHKEQVSKENELLSVTQQLEAYRAKQEAVNQEILRRRELEEQSDFYRVCLSEDAIADITLLQITRQKLKKPEIIDKIIYDTYVAKPVLEMIKRVLQNSTCSGIYKITCQETKEIYIGKSTDIKNRWQQHCKTAFNCGTIASSILHRKMQQYGIENFTFELLEKVPKDKLSEREKFYIDFYKTKETGLNERNG